MVGMEWEDMVVAVDMEDTDVEDMVDVSLSLGWMSRGCSGPWKSGSR